MKYELSDVDTHDMAEFLCELVANCTDEEPCRGDPMFKNINKLLWYHDLPIELDGRDGEIVWYDR